MFQDVPCGTLAGRSIFDDLGLKPTGLAPADLADPVPASACKPLTDPSTTLQLAVDRASLVKTSKSVLVIAVIAKHKDTAGHGQIPRLFVQLRLETVEPKQR